MSADRDSHNGPGNHRFWPVDFPGYAHSWARRKQVGLHICCLKDNKDHPDWDYIRQGNDRQFQGLIDFDKTYYKDDREKHECRPTNIPELRQKVESTDWENKARYLHLLDILEQDEDTWLYFSW